MTKKEARQQIKDKIKQLDKQYIKEADQSIFDQIKELKEYVEGAFADYNDINEDTRMQLELINQAIAELQAKDKQAGGKTRNPIGFISYNKEK